MSFRSLEAAILSELRREPGCSKLRQKDIMEWRIGTAKDKDFTAQAGERSANGTRPAHTNAPTVPVAKCARSQFAARRTTSTRARLLATQRAKRNGKSATDAISMSPGDPMMLCTTAMQGELRAAVKKAGGVRAYARLTGVSASHVSDVLNGSREPGEKILDPLHLEKRVSRTVRYFRAAIRKEGMGHG